MSIKTLLNSAIQSGAPVAMRHGKEIVVSTTGDADLTYTAPADGFLGFQSRQWDGETAGWLHGVFDGPIPVGVNSFNRLFSFSAFVPMNKGDTRTVKGFNKYIVFVAFSGSSQ